MSETLGYRLLRPGARAPVRTRPGDAAFDLLTDEAFTLQPGKRHRATTGVSIALQPEWAGLVVPRSGLAANHGITLLNAPGLIDPNYRGELMVVMHNAGDEPYAVHAGDRVRATADRALRRHHPRRARGAPAAARRPRPPGLRVVRPLIQGCR